MTPYELLEKISGEVVRGQIRYRDESRKIVVLATLNGDDMVFTDAGRLLAKQYEVVPAKRMGRPKKAAFEPATQAPSAGLSADG
jgi:hypothetical protein